MIHKLFLSSIILFVILACNALGPVATPTEMPSPVPPTATSAPRLSQQLTMTNRTSEETNQTPPFRITSQTPELTGSDDPLRMEEQLNHIIPVDPGEPYIMHQVIEAIVDQGSFLELQANWARNAIVGMARIGGHSVGIVAQEPAVMAGVIDIDASDKMTRFVRMCDCFNVPLVTFVDSPGFLPGIAQEHGGIIRHGAKLLYAYSEATVPKVCIASDQRQSPGHAIPADQQTRLERSRRDFRFALVVFRVQDLDGDSCGLQLSRKLLGFPHGGGAYQDGAARGVNGPMGGQPHPRPAVGLTV